MNKYELMFIVKTTMESDAASSLANSYKKLITDEQGDVTNENILRHMIIKLDEE